MAGLFSPRAAWLALVLACASCAARDDAAELALRDLERLAFVPGGQVHVGMLVPTVLFDCPEAILVDAFEVTRGEWRRFLAADEVAVGDAQRARAREWSQETDAWPASYMTQPEASRFAAWRGMRLPTPAEWMFCAVGPERRRFPWGVYERQDSVANTLELHLGRACAVGTFEGGRTPRDIYDLLGNVAEWVDGDVVPRGRARPEGTEDPERPVSALGGSFRTWSRPIVSLGQAPEEAYLARSLHPLSRLDDVGLRCVAYAAEYLERCVPELARDARTRARLVALGERWGRAAVPLLSELAERPGTPAAYAALLEGAGH